MAFVVIMAGSFLTGAVVAFALTPLAAALAARFGVVDRPDARKMHSTPTPRLGGVAVLAGLVGGCVACGLMRGGGTHAWLLASEERMAVLMAGTIVFAVGLVEDVRGVRPAVRVAAETAAAALLMTRAGFLIDAVWTPFGPPLALGWLAYPVTLVWFVGVTNAFNLIDGLDGLLASVGMASLLGSAAVGVSIGLTGTPLVALALAGALAGFLPWNWRFGRARQGPTLVRREAPGRANRARPASDGDASGRGRPGAGSRARVFLGDSGSLLVGFVAAAASIRAARYASGGTALYVLVALCAVPVMETLLTVARRYVGERPFFSPDRSHIHHILVNAKGLTVPRAVAALAGVQLLCSGTALFTRVRLGWYSLAPGFLLLAAAAWSIWWLGYIELRVVWHHLRQSLFMRRRRQLSALVRIARAGEIVRGAASVPELKARLHEAAQEGRFAYLALEFSERGARALGGSEVFADCRRRHAVSRLANRDGEAIWLFSAAGPPADDAEGRRAGVTFAVQLPVGGELYGQLVCHRHEDLLGPGPAVRDLHRLLAEPVADALRRLGRKAAWAPLAPTAALGQVGG